MALRLTRKWMERFPLASCILVRLHTTTWWQRWDPNPHLRRDWCSSLAYSVKRDGSLCICTDPQKLNQALKWCPHKVPTLEELNPQFPGSTVFSKLDAKAGYWSVHLDPDSQLITTFWTPFGRYCWTRLPFGLRMSQDIFQARMDEILEDLPGMVGITDDVCMHGKDE